MTEIGWATIGIIPSARGLGAALEKQTKPEMAKAGKAGGAQFGAAFKSGLAPLVAGGAAIGFLNDIKNQASDAEQAVGGLQSVFGEYAAAAQKASESSAQSLGLARTEYQELITLSGALLKNKGLSDFAAQAQKLLEVGADLAATYGGSTKDAVDALNSALRGESDPIERYAVSLNETAVNAELAAKGQSKLTGAALDQAKTQARLSLIMEQSADAQGAFNREADTAAGAAQRASAQWADMRRELGEKLLPVYSEFVSTLNNDALPALESTAGVVGDLAGALEDLPGPVKAAAAGFLALKAAQKLGAGNALASGLTRVSGGLETARIRAMLASDAYRANAGSASAAAGANTRLAASYRAVKAASAGAAPGVASFAKSAGSLAALAGAFEVFNSLQPDADAMGRYVEKVQALAGPQLPDQIAAITKELKKQQQIADNANIHVNLGVIDIYSSDKASTAADKVGRLKDALASLKHEQELGEIAAKNAARSTKDYSWTVDTATDSVRALIDKENSLRDGRLKNRRDAIALQQAFADAAKEAADGAKTLDITTQAGRDNSSALLDLADQWNNSSDKVRNARGAFENMRQQFITLADQMNGPGGTRADAKALADQLLDIPRKGPYNATVNIPGMKEKLDQLREANALLASMGRTAAAQGLKNRGELADIRPKSTPAPAWDERASGAVSRTVTNGPGVYIANQTVVPANYNEFLRQQEELRRRAALAGERP